MLWSFWGQAKYVAEWPRNCHILALKLCYMIEGSATNNQLIFCKGRLKNVSTIIIYWKTVFFHHMENGDELMTMFLENTKKLRCRHWYGQKTAPNFIC